MAGEGRVRDREGVGGKDRDGRHGGMVGGGKISGGST